MIAKFGLEREIENRLSVIDYRNGNGDFHFHSQIEICIVTSGEADALVNNKRQRLKKGEISVALSYETHMYLPVTSSDFTVVIIPADLCRGFTDNMKLRRLSSPFIKDPETTVLLSRYIDELKTHLNDTLMSTGYVYLILGLIMKSVLPEQKETAADTELSSKLLMYIHNNFTSDISLSSVSNHFGYNPAYISAFFKSSFNIGIKRYINIVRLNNSVKLLKENKYSVTHCALESGFNSLRTFYRVFEAEFGFTPKEYIKKDSKNLGL